MQKKRILSQPTLDRTDMPQRHQEQIYCYQQKKKSVQHQPPQNR